MASTYTPTGATWTTAVTVPDDGDPCTAASINAPVEVALDNAKYLYDHRGLYRPVVAVTANVTSAIHLTSGSPNYSHSLTNITTVAGDIVEVSYVWRVRIYDGAAPTDAKVDVTWGMDDGGAVPSPGADGVAYGFSTPIAGIVSTIPGLIRHTMTGTTLVNGYTFALSNLGGDPLNEADITGTYVVTVYRPFP